MYNGSHARKLPSSRSRLSGLTLFRLAPQELGRLAELRSRLCQSDPSASAWDGDRLRAGYESRLMSGEMAVWIACRQSQDVGYAWFQVRQGEHSLKEIACSPESGETAGYTTLIAAGLEWLKRQGGGACRYSGDEGCAGLDQALRACGFALEEEHIQMRASLDRGQPPDGSLRTRSFTEIGDASWLLALVEDCLECRHAYDRQDLLDVIKRRDSLSFTAWEGEQPVGFLLAEILPGRGRTAGGPFYYVVEIGVLPAFRRRGYATRMLAEGFARGRERGLHEARLHVVADNQAGLRLYRKLGFEEVKRMGWWVWSH